MIRTFLTFGLLLLFVSFSDPARSQMGGEITPSVSQVMVGDTTVVATFVDLYSCPPNLSVAWHSNPDFRWDDSGRITFIPKHPGLDRDSALVYFYPVPYPCQNYPPSVSFGIAVTATSEPSMFVRPQAFTEDLIADTLTGKWRGKATVLLTNNYHSPLTFKEFRVAKDSLGISLSATDSSGVPVTQVTLDSGRHALPLTLSFSGAKGAEYYEVDEDISLGLTAYLGAEKLTEFLIPVHVRIHPEVWHIRAAIPEDTLLFTNAAGTSDSKTFQCHLLPGTKLLEWSQPESPLSLASQSVGDSLFTFTVACSPITNGYYEEKVKLLFEQKDFVGDPREDSVYVHLIASSPSDPNAPAEWIRTDCPARNVRRLAILPDSGVVAMDTSVWLRDRRAGVWNRIVSSSPVALACDRKGDIYVSNYMGFIARDLEDTTWRPITTPSYQVAYSTDIGNIWVREASFNPLDTLFISGIEYYRISYRDPNPGIASASARSGDGGKTWLEAGDPGLLYDSNYSGTYSAVAGDMTFYGYNGASTDFGVHWRPIQLVTPFPKGIAALRSGDAMIADSVHGIYYTSDHGVTWVQYNDGLPSKAGIRTIIEDRAGRVFLGTDSGLYESTREFNPTTQSVRTEPLTVAHSICWPDPADHAVTIASEASEVSSVTVLDALGRIALNVESDRGQPSLTFDISSLKPGTYHYIARTSSGKATGDFVVIR